MSSNSKLRMGGVLLVAATLVLASGSALASNGKVDADVRAGFGGQSDGLTLGAGLLVNVGNEGNWYFNPNFEAGLDESGNPVSVNGDFHYDFVQNGSATFYMGGGPALLLSHGDDDAGLDILGGVAGRYGAVRPFAQLKGVIANDDQVVLMGGIRF